MSSRRNFLLQTTLGLAATGLTPLLSAAARPAGPQQPKDRLSIGVAGYTFYKFKLDQAIAMMQRANIRHISLKDVHLPLQSSPEQIAAVLAQFRDAGINVYAVGVIYMKTKQSVDEAFAYANKVGVPMIVGVPTPELLDYTEQQVKQYDIRLAIHNHGPEDALYPGPRNAWEHIRDRDARMGLCIDIGHATRAGEDPAKAVLAYKDRVFDLHLKDVTVASKDGKPTEIGRGVINFSSFVRALDKIRYKGICSIEYEKEMNDPLPGIAESAGYFKGVVNTVKS
ncbi:sugar phosphate isomerase/epimerase [Chitinophaga sp. G-6-1-13]|uniref:Sugar phosphate isomerase/epimerase n=1 Tax=Chitinophaga fulva TaxID=2728842 RepID=A0A848GP81_9BACT|nr:sugar phosphate isomerase/epimerase [Chitinophaga fulva]NML40214.1 sugar phosphate isomerase/epimerase [Chitinophaga fulva]